MSLTLNFITKSSHTVLTVLTTLQPSPGDGRFCDPAAPQSPEQPGGERDQQPEDRGGGPRDLWGVTGHLHGDWGGWGVRGGCRRART